MKVSEAIDRLKVGDTVWVKSKVTAINFEGEYIEGKEIEYPDQPYKNIIISSGFGFEISTFFGINNVKAYHRIDDDLYLNLKRGIEDHVEMLEEVDYVDYLELCAELEKSN